MRKIFLAIALCASFVWVSFADEVEVTPEESVSESPPSEDEMEQDEQPEPPQESDETEESDESEPEIPPEEGPEPTEDEEPFADEPEVEPEPEPDPEENEEPQSEEAPEEEVITPRLIINEVMRGSEVNPEKEAFIELYNPGTEDVSLFGWRISGVTVGGLFIDIVPDETHSVPAGGYFLFSHYTNSSSSVLESRPQFTKASVFIPEGDIHVVLKNPQGDVSDEAFVAADFSWGDLPTEDEAGEMIFRSYERLQTSAEGDLGVVFGDGLLPESWSPAERRVGLKESVARSFATPLWPNTPYLPPEEEPEDDEPEELPEPLPIFINEVLPNPKEDDAANEFIELWNVGEEDADLFGWSLDDDLEKGGSYIFGEGALIEAGGFLTVYRPETEIVLANEDSVHLLDNFGREVDSFIFESARAGRSWGRSLDDPLVWRGFSAPTPDAPNEHYNEAPLAVIGVQGDTAYMRINVTGEESLDPDDDELTFLWDFGDEFTDTVENPKSHTYASVGEWLVTLTVTDEWGLSTESLTIFNATQAGGGGGGGSQKKAYPHYELINEFMPNPEGSDTEGEWVELHNPMNFDVDLGGWYLDDGEKASSPYQFAEGFFLPAGGTVVFYAYDIKLSLKNSEDTVRLLDPNKEEVQAVAYTEGREGESYALGDGAWRWTPMPTPGWKNEFPPPPKAYPVGSVRFDSVLPNPAGDDGDNEKITLKNMGGKTIDLTGWVIEDKSGKQVTFGSLAIGTGQALTLGRDVFGLSLNNSNEFLLLRDPMGNQIDKISWRSSAAGQWMMNANALSDGMTGVVEKVKDGDTFSLRFGERLITVRLIGVDTPETVHPFKPIEFYGRQASDYLKNLLTGQQVTLRFDESKLDKYGRVLAYVYLGNLLVNTDIIQGGYGTAYIRFPFRMLSEFVEIERVAKEAERGLWADDSVRKVLEEDILLDDEELPEEDELLLLKEECDEGGEGDSAEPCESEDDEDEEVEEEEAEILGEKEMELCPSGPLRIESFLPNPQKGEAVEYVRIVNEGDESLCLAGWSLDDIQEGGSKPFIIKGGAIAAGAMRTFRQKETRLALNNSDDCVSLIDPMGVLVDQICYEKTHKNEVFTHEGGDWAPAPRKSSAKKSTAKTPKPPSLPSRSTTEFQWELVTGSYRGVIEEWNEEAQEFYLREEDGSRVAVSYADGDVDMARSRVLMDLDGPIEVGVRAGTAGTADLLVAIRPLAGAGVAGAEGGGWPWGDVVLIAIVLLGLVYFRRRM